MADLVADQFKVKINYSIDFKKFNYAIEGGGRHHLTYYVSSTGGRLDLHYWINTTANGFYIVQVD